MSLIEFFSQSQNWSPLYGLALFTVLIDYLVLFRPSNRASKEQKGIYLFNRFMILRPSLKNLTALITALSLAYLVLGSPLAHLLEYRLHSIVVIQQVFMMIIVPFFFWLAMPTIFTRSSYHPKDRSVRSIILSWFIGIAALWVAH